MACIGGAEAAASVEAACYYDIASRYGLLDTQEFTFFTPGRESRVRSGLPAVRGWWQANLIPSQRDQTPADGA